MRTSGFSDAVALVNGATSATALFGGDQDAAKAKFRRLSKLLHPDMNGGDPEAARAFGKLSALWDDYHGDGGTRRPTEVTRNSAYAVFEDGGRWMVVERATSARAGETGLGAKLASVTDGCPAFVVTDVESRLVAQRDGSHAAHWCERPDDVTTGRGAFMLDHLNDVVAGWSYHPADLAWVSKRVIYLAAAMAKAGVELAREPSECLAVAPDVHRLCLVTPWELRDSDGGVPSQRKLVESFARCVRPHVGEDAASRRVMHFVDGVVSDRHAESCDLLAEFDGLLYSTFGSPKWHDLRTR